MFERYTETARSPIFFGRDAASQFGGDCIEPEHLLIGILRADPSIAKRLRAAGVTEVSVGERLKPGKEMAATSAGMPLSGASKRAFAFGAEEADRARSRPLLAEHLLLGIAREEPSLAAQILFDAGLTIAELRELAANSGSAELNS